MGIAMQLRCREPIGRRLIRLASKFICGLLILAIGLPTGRIAGADSGKTQLDKRRHDSEIKGGGIEGIVKDEKGRRIAGARVENRKNKNHEARRTLTDKNGHYVLDELNESLDGFRILVRAAGHSPVVQEVQPGPAGKPARVDFTLSPGHVLHGRVVDENGKPISGVVVEPLVAWTREPATHSDKDGRFEIDSLPADAKFGVSKSGYTMLWWVPLRLDSAGLVTVVLQPMGVIRGRVVDAQSGKPLDHFNVWFNSPRAGAAPNIPSGYDRALFHPGRKFASSDGTFTISDLTNKLAVEVSVAADGYKKCVLPVVVAAPLKEVKPVAFALAPIEPAKLATYSGRVLDHRGQPVRGANLRLITSSLRSEDPDDRNFFWNAITSGELAGRWYCDQFLEAVSDSQGRFAFKGVLPDKHWQLAYWGPGVPRDRVLGTSQTVPGPAPSLTIKIPQPARVVVTIDRVKYPDAWQLVGHPRGTHSDSLQMILQRGQTKVEIQDLAPGDYVLLLLRAVLKDGGLDIVVIASQRIHLEPGETKEVRF
jgi:Carboxypeptidase regulatory-like domain